MIRLVILIFVLAGALSARPMLYVLSIGSESYRDFPLHGPKAEAKAWADGFKEAQKALLYRPLMVHTLTDPSREEILAHLRDLQQRLTHEDRLILYLAGSTFADTTGTRYYLGADGTQATLVSQGIDMRLFSEPFLGAGIKITLIDHTYAIGNGPDHPSEEIATLIGWINTQDERAHLDPLEIRATRSVSDEEVKGVFQRLKGWFGHWLGRGRSE